MTDNKNLIKLWGNHEKRQNFMDAYRDWGVWLTISELELTYYRYLMPDGAAVIAMEHNQKTYARQSLGYEFEIGVCYYVLKPGDPFYPGAKSSISCVNDLLKYAKMDLQKQSKADDSKAVTPNE